MMRRPSCGPICGRRRTSRSLSNAGERRRRNLANADAMRLLLTFSRMLPVSGDQLQQQSWRRVRRRANDRFLHARLQGTKLGVFDVYFDSAAAEQVEAGQAKAAGEWRSVLRRLDIIFTGRSESGRLVRRRMGSRPGVPSESATKCCRLRDEHESGVRVRRYTITTEVQPPKQIHARARLQCDVTEGGRARCCSSCRDSCRSRA